MLPKIICVLLVVCLVDVIGYRDEEPENSGGYGHYREDSEPLTIRRYVHKQTVKTLGPSEIEAVKGAINKILSGHKQDRLFSPMPSKENLDKRSITDKRTYEPGTYDNRYIKTTLNHFMEQTDETSSESTTESDNDSSSTNEDTDESNETNELHTKGPTRSSLPIPFHNDDMSTNTDETKEGSQTEPNEELIGATEAIPTRVSSFSTIDDTLLSTEGSTKEDYQTDTNEELTSATELIPTRSSLPIVLTFHQTTDERTKENDPIEITNFIKTRHDTVDISSTGDSSSIANYQIVTRNEVGATTSTDIVNEVKKAEREDTEEKDSKEEKSELEGNQPEETEVKENEAADTDVKEENSEIEESKPEESEAEDTKVETTQAKDKAAVTKKTKFVKTTQKITTTTTSTTTRTTKFQLDVPALLEIIANLTYDYEMNLTDNLNETLLRLSIPTCEVPTTTEKIGDFIDYDANATGTIVAKCFVCGLEEESIPRHAQCADAFAGDFLPLVPVDMTARGRISKYRKYCRYLDVPHYLVNASMPRSVYGRWTGGCSVRWIDLSGVYTQRSCRNKDRAIMGRHYASKRMAKLEMALTSQKEGCISSPMATLVPLSRGISLYARFHACVCTGSWCNAAATHTHWLALLPAFVYVSMYLVTTR